MRGGARVLAVIPARGGSKGVPRKNLARLGGSSLVARAISHAQALPWIDLVVLTTDDLELAEEGRRAGIEVPSLRPQELATDVASGFDVWRHAHLEAEDRTGSPFELSILLQPTSPFRQPRDIETCVALLLGSEFGVVTTISPTPSHYTPEKTMVMQDSGRVEPYLAAAGFQATRQLIPNYHHLNGAVYAARRQALMERDGIFDGATGAVVIDRTMVNIDEPLDLEWAQWLWERGEGTETER